jgi:excinuclease ABC subunit C
MTASSLEGVEGLGPKRRDGLLQEFGSLDAIRGASVAELHERGKIPEAVARSLYDHLQGPMRPKPEKGGALDG